MDETQALDCTQALDDWINEDDDSTEHSLVAWLEVDGRRHDIHLGETKIGRDPETCQIVLHNKVLSKQHAVFEVEGDIHTIADLGSMNKTRIGKMILKPNVRFALQGGESLRFGDVQAKYIIKPKIQNQDSGSETESEPMFSLNDSEEKPTSPVSSHHLSDFIPETPAATKTNSTQIDIDSKTFVPESPSASQNTHISENHTKLIVPESPDNISAVKIVCEENDDSFFFDPSQHAKEKHVIASYKNSKVQLTHATARCEDFKIREYNSDVSTDVEDDDVPTQLFSESHAQKDLSTTNMELSKNKENTLKNNEKDMSDSGISMSRDTNTKSTDDDQSGNSNVSAEIEDIFNQPTQVYPVLDKSPKVARNTEYTDEMSPSVQNEASDSTQDIMNAFDLPVVKSSAKSQNIHEDDDDVPTQLFLENEESPVFKKPFAMAPKTKKNLWDEIYSENVNADILEAATQQFSSDDHQSKTVCNNDNIFVAPTLPFDDPDSSYKFQLQSKSVQKEKCSIGIFDDIFSQPTQLYSDSNTDTINEDNIPTQHFDPAPKEELINNEDKQVEKNQSDDELDIFNKPTQIFSTPKPKTNENCDSPINKFTNVYLSGKKGTGGKKSTITSLNLSPVSVGGQDNACDDDDDLPPTQLFTEPSILNKSPMLKVDTTPTQSILQEVTKKTNASCADTLKESEASTHVEDSDYDAPTQIFKEKSITEDLNECDAPTQLFTDIYDKVSDNSPQELIPGESNNSSKELPKGISQTWALLDADETQDLTLDGGLAIDKPCLDTREPSLSVEQAGECENIDIHDSSSNVSENLLDDMQAKGENDGIPLSLRSGNCNGSSSASDDASYSTDSKKTGASTIEKERMEEIILKDSVVDNLHIKQQDTSKTSAIAENEGYNSDESTDIESELVVSDILEHTSKADISHGSEMSKLELSSESNVQGNKDCITPLTTASLLLSPKNLNDMASTGNSLTKNQELHREAKVEDNEKYQFKRVSRMFPVTLSSETLPSSQSQSTQDSSPLIDMPFANISILDSKQNTSQDTASNNLQNQKNEKKLSNLGKKHNISDSDSEDGVCDVSQNLFDLPLEHNQGEIQNKHKENLDNSESKTSKKGQINKTLKRRGKITETPKGEGTINESHKGEDKMKKTSVGEDKINDTLKGNDKINKTPKGEDKTNESPKGDKIYETPKEEDKLKPHKRDSTLSETLKGEDKINNTLKGASPKRESKINESPKREGKINDSPKREGKINESPKREGKINESPKRKTTEIHSETGKSEVETAEGNKKAPKKQIEKKIEQNTENTSGEEIDETAAVSTKDESTCESNSRINSSLSFTPKTRKKQSTSVDTVTFSISKNRSPDLNCTRKSKRKIEYNDELFNNSKGSDSFIGFNESPTKKEKILGESEDRLKNKRENEKVKCESKTAPQNITEACLKEDSNHLPEIIVGRTSTAERFTTSISDGVRKEKIVNNKDSGTKEVSKQQFTGHHTRSKDKENEKSLPAREKRKRGTAKTNSEEVNVVERRTRTKSKESINESLNRESSTCRDSAGEVTIDDVQNIHRSGRKRQNSDSSTVSNLSILSVSSNRNAAKSDLGTSNTSAESVTKGRLDQSFIKDEKSNMSTQRVVENGKKVRMSKRSLSSKIDDDKHEEPDIIAEPSIAKLSDRRESSRPRMNKRYKCPDLPVTEVSTNKSRTEANKKEDSDVKVTIETLGVKNKKPETGAELNEPESSAQGRLNSSRIRRAPKRFSCDGNITDVAQLASTRSSRTRKAHTLETLQEPVETLPAKRGRHSAMPNLSVPTVNHEEVEITQARQNSTQKRNVDVDDSKNENDTTQIHRRGCKSTTAKSMPLLEKSLSLQETNIQQTKVKTSGTSCKTRASIATSNLATKADLVVCKKTRNSMIVEKTKSGDRDTAEVKYDAGSSRSSSQSSEDSKVCQRSKRKRGADNSTDQLLSTPKSTRSGRSRIGSPSLKDSILWSPSQRQQQASTKPRVLFTGYKDANDEKIVISFGGTVVESPRDCTVLVTVNIRRTCKLLAVIGRGLPIVSPAWLAASKRARNFVDPWEYLVKDTEAEEKYGFRLDQSLRSASRVLLFEGLSLHATHSVKPPPDQMKEIIECSGGEYLDMPPKKYAPQVRILSCTEDEHQWTSFKHLGIPILGTEFILTGLLRHELLLDEFQLG